MDALTMGAAGSFLGGMGQFAGAASDIFGGSNFDAHKAQKKAKKFAREQRWYSMNETIQRRAVDAKKAGLHPLAALGISASGGPSVSIGAGPQGNTGRALRNMGQGINKALNAGQSEITKAQIENINAETRLKSAQADRILTDSPPGQGGIHEENLPPPAQRSYEPGIKPMETVTTWENDQGENVLDFFPAREVQDLI